MKLAGKIDHTMLNPEILQGGKGERLRVSMCEYLPGAARRSGAEGQSGKGLLRGGVPAGSDAAHGEGI